MKTIEEEIIFSKLSDVILKVIYPRMFLFEKYDPLYKILILDENNEMWFFDVKGILII